MPVFDNCDSIASWMAGGVGATVANSADAAPNSTGSIQGVLPAGAFWFTVACWKAMANWAANPILTLYIKTANSNNTMNVNVITGTSYVEHWYPVSIPAGVWTKVTIDTRQVTTAKIPNADGTGWTWEGNEAPNMTALVAIRVDSTVPAGNGAAVNVDEIELNPAGNGGGGEFPILPIVVLAGVVVAGYYLLK